MSKLEPGEKRTQMRIHKELIGLHKALRKEIIAKWNRSLPFADELFNRWEKAKFLGFGDGASVYDSSLIIGDVKIGNNTWIGPFTVLDGSGGLIVGDSCSISCGVQIYTHDSVKWALSGGKAEYEREHTRIGNRCYIGPLTVITKGVTIGDHCIIGAFSYVDTEIPDCSIARGQPAKIVGRVKLKEDGEVDYEYLDL